MNRMQKFIYVLLKGVCRLVLRYLFRWNCSGSENLPKNEPLIFAMNHVHRLDAIIIMAALPGFVCPIIAYDVIKNHYFLSAIVRFFGRSVGAVVIDRNDGSKVSALKAAQRKLRSGLSILIAPEGTRNRDEKLGNFYDGAVFIALLTGTKIVPVVSFGYTKKSLAKIIYSKAIRVVIGEPIYLTKVSRTNTYIRQAGTHELHERIRKLLLNPNAQTK